MRSLFIKIFLSFAAIILISFLIGGLVAYYNKPEQPQPGLSNFASQALNQYASQAMEAYHRGGSTALQEYRNSLRRQEIKLFLLIPGQTVAPTPPALTRLMQRALNQGQLVRGSRERRPKLAMPLDERFRPAIAVGVILPEIKGGDRPPPHRLTPGFVIPRLLSLFTIASIVCYLLARSLTSSIRRLRTATRQFAGGDLTTRVKTCSLGSSEIHQLGVDFNGMAERIEDLITSQKRLQRDISHELRSPLARLNVALELARQRAGDDAQQALDRIERESERLNDMIGQLLRLNQLELTAAEQPTPLDLAPLLEKLVADANFEAQHKQVQVRLHQPAQLPLTGSPELLNRALENIVRNAIHYSPGGGHILIDARQQTPDTLVIEIRDSGPGVPEEELEKIFQPFYRVAAARDRRTGGTGIGLAISQRAIERHGGRVFARNHPGGGLLITIELPTRHTISD